MEQKNLVLRARLARGGGASAGATPTTLTLTEATVERVILGPQAVNGLDGRSGPGNQVQESGNGET